ncbi:hypothetical protein Bca4012_065226 [Brassica carinata]
MCRGGKYTEEDIVYNCILSSPKCCTPTSQPQEGIGEFAWMTKANEEVVAAMIHHLTLEILRRRSCTKLIVGEAMVELQGTAET